MVVDCFAPFQPLVKPEPEPAPPKDPTTQPKPQTSIFRRLQGVASRDKATTVGSNAPTRQRSGGTPSLGRMSSTGGTSVTGKTEEEGGSVSSNDVPNHFYTSASTSVRSPCSTVHSTSFKNKVSLSYFIYILEVNFQGICHFFY